MKLSEIHPNIKIRFVIQFVLAVAFTSVFPFLSIYFAERIGATIAGLMLMTLVVTGILGGFTGGFISDRWGRKKIMLLGESVMAITFILIAMVNSPWFDSPYLTFLLLLVNMFFNDLSEPASQAMVIDVTTSKTRKLIYAAFYWVHNLSFAFGSIIGAFFFQEHRFELFLVMGGVMIISVLITKFFITETYTPQPSEEGVIDTKTNMGRGQLAFAQFLKGTVSLVKSYRTILVDRVFLIFIVWGVLISSLEFQLSNYIGIRLHQDLSGQSALSLFSYSLDLDGFRMVGILQTENTILVVLLVGLVAMIARRFADHKVLYTGLLIYTFGYTVMGFAANPWLLILAMFFVTVGEVMYSPIRHSFLGDIAREDARSSYVAVSNMTYQIAMLVGGVFIIIGEYLSANMISAIYFAMGISGILLARSIMPEIYRRRQSQENPSDEPVDLALSTNEPPAAEKALT